MGSKVGQEIAAKYFKHNGNFAQWYRKTMWHHAVFRRMGMKYHDTMSAEHHPIVEEAVRRLPASEYDARIERLHRAVQLGFKHEWLPKDQWTTWENEDWYLLPYLSEVKREILDTKRYRQRRPVFLSRIFHEKQEH